MEKKGGEREESREKRKGKSVEQGVKRGGERRKSQTQRKGECERGV